MPDEKEKEEKKHRPVQIQYPCLVHLMSASLQIPFEICDFWNIKKRIFKLQLEACLISQGLTLIFTAPVYTKDGLSQKTSLQYFVLCDDLRLVGSFGLQSLKSYIILQAYYWPYIKDKVLHSQKCNKILLHQWAFRRMSTHLYIHSHTHRNTLRTSELWPQDGRKNKVLIVREGSRDLWNVAELCLW